MYKVVFNLTEKKARLIGIPTVALIVYLLKLIGGFDSDWESVAKALGFTFVYWNGSFYFYTYLSQRMPDYRDTWKRILVQLVFILGLTFTVKSLAILLFCDDALFSPKWVGGMIFAFAITTFVSTIYEAVNFFTLCKRTLLEAEQLRRAKSESEFKMLSNQVNPHFLFNSLNTLVSLIPENPETAVSFTHKLSEVYRYVLQSKDRELVSFEEELAFTEAYIYLMKIRHGDNLEVSIDVHPDAQYKSLPPLVLQMLVENATKHNVISSKRNLQVKVMADDVSVSVWNNIQPKMAGEESTGTGLDNIQKRYAFFTDKEVHIHFDKERFEVILPLLEVERYHSKELA